MTGDDEGGRIFGGAARCQVLVVCMVEEEDAVGRMN